MAEVRLENVHKSYGRGTVAAVRGVTFSVASGQLLVLAGPPGCGKTTTLRLIAGLESPSSGEIFIGGANATSLSAARREVAMMFQDPSLFPHLTVFDNMALGLRLRRKARKEIEATVMNAAEMLGLDLLLDRLPEELSGGEAQRVALGRAMVRRPKVFLLDEPLSNLDPALRVQLRTELLRLHARLAATMIYVTHDQSEAMTLGQRLAVMREGGIEQIATPACLYNQPANKFVAGFVGSPPINFFRGKLVRDGQMLQFQSIDTNGAGASRMTPPPSMTETLAPFAGAEILLGVRPEAIVLAPSANAPSTGSVGAEVEFVEQSGADAFVHCTSRCGPFIMRLSASADAPPPRQPANVWIDWTRAHFFDAITGNRLV